MAPSDDSNGAILFAWARLYSSLLYNVFVPNPLRKESPHGIEKPDLSARHRKLDYLAEEILHYMRFSEFLYDDNGKYLGNLTDEYLADLFAIRWRDNAMLWVVRNESLSKKSAAAERTAL